MDEYYREERYEIEFPSDWGYVHASEGVAFFRHDEGCGAINISVLVAPSPESQPREVFNELSQHALEPRETASRQEGVAILSGEANQGDSYWRYWVFWRAPVAVNVTYNCRAGDQHIEADDVAQIIESIRLF